MPTFSNMQIPPPKSWDEFEELTLSAMKIKWGNPNLTRHGRQGQAQNGVDIYGANSFFQLAGVQCKLTVSTIDKAIIDSEIINVESFSPPLQALYIATTATTDAILQKYVRSVSEKRKSQGKFSVEIFFWNDLIQELIKDNSEFSKHYPQIFNHQHNNKTISQRDKDIQTLESVLSYIDLERLSSDTSGAPKVVNADFFEAPDVFRPIRLNSLFHLNDNNLLNLLDNFLEKWCEISSKSQYIYDLNFSGSCIFPTPGDCFRSEIEANLFSELRTLYKDFFDMLKELVDYVRTNYPEIDFKKTSYHARKYFLEIESKAKEWGNKNGIT